MANEPVNCKIEHHAILHTCEYLEKRGFAFDESSFKYNDKGELTVAYLKDEIAGFAVHFNQK